MSLFLIEMLIALPVLIVCGYFIARKVSKSLDTVDFDGDGKSYDY